MPTHSYYGDGSEIPDDVIQHIRDVSWQCAIGFQMELGECLLQLVPIHRLPGDVLQCNPYGTGVPDEMTSGVPCS